MPIRRRHHPYFTARKSSSRRQCRFRISNCEIYYVLSRTFWLYLARRDSFESHPVGGSVHCRRGEGSMKKRMQHMTVGILLCVLISLLPLLWIPNFSFDRWDMHEEYTPLLDFFQRHICRGELPFINPFQHLGEAFEFDLHAGPLYPVYAASFAL